MARTFYTERDIEDMAKRGVTEIQVDDSVYITDVAREKMDRLGIKRKGTNGGAPSPSGLKSSDTGMGQTPLTAQEKQQVVEQVKSGVIARLGAGVDTAVVEQIVKRVVDKL